jgi:mono/diheme cytochrome c family protein
MRARQVIVVAAAALLPASAVVIAQQSPPATNFPPERIKRGAALYAEHCESCHGVRMIGPPWAIDLATFPRDKPERFIDSVTHGIRAMPPWGDLLKPDEIEALWAYVVAGEPKP